MTDATYRDDDYVPVSSGGGISIRVPLASLVNQQPAPSFNAVQQLTAPADQDTQQPKQRGVIDKLLGLTGPRYETWPEKLARSAFTLPGDVLSTGQVPITDEYGRVVASQPEIQPGGMPSDAAVQRVQDLAGIVGSASIPAAAMTPREIGALGVAGGKVVQPELQLPPGGVFHSAVKHALANAPQDKMTGDQWQGWLRNQPGVKQEELDWLGLPGGKQVVNKADMLAHAEGHGAKIEEVEKTGANASQPEDYPGDAHYEAWEENPDATDDELARRADEIRTDWAEDQAINDIGAGGPKYSDYQLPGGDNYRELLLTMPNKEHPKITALRTQLRPYENGERTSQRDYNRYGNLQDQLTQALEQHPGNTPYFSSHWDEPNVLVHMRMNDREIPGVGKSLHLEEVQSDWHQAGRKQGYAGPKPVPDMRAAVDKAWSESGRPNLTAENWGSSYNPEAVADQLVADGRMTPANRAIIANYAEAVRRSLGVPDAPFKTTWADLALKRAIAKAAREGYDAISWTPGEQQAERYDLSKYLDRAELTHNREGRGTLTYTTKDGQERTRPVMSQDDLANFLGKDTAQKLYDQSYANNGKATLRGLDLKVGGEGMKKFYDKMLVDKANAIGKKFGAKVEYKALPGTGKSYEIQENPALTGTFHILESQGSGDAETTRMLPQSFMSRAKAEAFVGKQPVQPPVRVPVLRLTPKLKDVATHKGFPLFMHGSPFMFTPVAPKQQPQSKYNPDTDT